VQQFAVRTQTSATSGPRIYVSDETGTEVVVVDPDARRVLQRIAVGKRPRGIRVSRDGTQLYVALSGSPIAGPGVDESKLPPADRAADGIGVIDLATGAVVRKYQSGNDPESFAISGDGKMLFVSNEDAAEVSVLDLDTGSVKTRIKIGEEPEGVAVSPDGRVIYVACEGSNEVVAIDAGTYEILAHLNVADESRCRAPRMDRQDSWRPRTAPDHDLRRRRAQGDRHFQIPKGPTNPVPARPWARWSRPMACDSTYRSAARSRSPSSIR
jgi:YVTN family beta-propeller protein